MRFFFYNLSEAKKKRLNTYTYGLIRWIGEKEGHEFVDSSRDADYILVSINSFPELNVLRRVRKLFPDSKIVAGGHISLENPISLLRWADYVNVGAGFDFFRDIKEEKPDDMPFVLSRKKEIEEIRPNYNIYWEKCPIIQIAKNTFSYWYATGCRYKCSFCLTSWANKHEVNPIDPQLIKGRLSRSAALYLICNEYYGPSASQIVTSTRISDYLRNPDGFAHVPLIRVGVEGAKKTTRDFFRKGLSEEEIRAFFKKTKGAGKRVNIFMIGGLESNEEIIENLKNLIPPDRSHQPKISFIFNYLVPQTGTPLEFMDLRRIRPIDLSKILFELKAHNHRVGVSNLNLSLARAYFWALLSRSDPETVDRVLRLKEIKSSTEMLEKAYALGLDSLIEGNISFGLRTFYFEQKEHMKAQLKEEIKKL